VEGGPFFLFLHYWDPHDPYSPPAPYDTIFDPSYRGGLGNSVNLRTLGFTAAEQVGATLSEETGIMCARDIEHAFALYDGEIAFTDEWIGELLRGLDERGLRSNTLIVLHGDHGEEFFEHNGVGHGHTLYNEVIRVPLMFVLPGIVPGNKRIARQARLLDVTPTVLDLMGLTSDFAFEGISRAPALRGGADAVPNSNALFPPYVAYTEGVRQGLEKKAVTAYPWKLLYEISSKDEMLFDLGKDPGETENLMPESPEAAVPFEELLARGLFEMSDAWYIEVAGGDVPHTFDIEISTAGGTWGGWVCPAEIAHDGNLEAAPGKEALSASPGSVFRRSGLEARDPITLGFKIHAPRGIHIRFDFRMDGKPATARTFIGEALANPDKMPFTVHKKRGGAEALSGPPQRPEPPYVLLWQVGGRYGGEIPADLSEDVKKQLRALGYIQ